MYIKYQKQLSYKAGSFYPVHPLEEYPISWVYLFLHESYRFIQNKGVKNFIKNVYRIDKNEFEYESIHLLVDNSDKKAYIYVFNDSEFYNNYNLEMLIELFKKDYKKAVIISQNNFEHLIIMWDKIWHLKFVKFILLYQDDQSWFDVKPFETQEAMEEFVAQHTQRQLSAQ